MDDAQVDDGFKWFGEGFDGFPKRLPDDCIEYIVYVIDAKLETLQATQTRLNEVLKASVASRKTLLKDYIWQRDAFELKLEPQLLSAKATQTSSSKGARLHTQPYLRGRTNFGDSVADEWLVVYLLLDLSKKFPDAWIRVYDTDGEFLLIEAAKALPKWLNPEIAENRVWISNGHLRIIPLDEGASPSSLLLDDAISFIKGTPEKLIISPFIEDEAFYRLREYPSSISSSLHHALITIPRRLAHILHQNPAYISPAVESFYLRDSISLRPLSSKDLATLTFPPEDFVTVSTRFTKVGFAQLRSQIFDPPPAWTGVLPRMQDPKSQMGMKLTCGFEMLIGDNANQDKKVVREIKLLLEDLETSGDTLPSDTEIAAWPQTQDDDKWLDIDYNDFEDELSGKSSRKEKAAEGTPGDGSAPDHLRKMVSRFEDFLKDDSAGIDGLDEDFEEDIDQSDSEIESDAELASGEAAAANDSDFKKAMEATRDMGDDDIERSGLLAEARRLALEDAEDHSEPDEDEEMKKVMALMEDELRSKGALNISSKSTKAQSRATSRPVFGPERPPHLQNSALDKHRGSRKSADEELGFGDGELSSDDEEFNDVDLGLAENMLQSFKGQAGMAGPAGNLMKAMGVNMPRDEASDSN